MQALSETRPDDASKRDDADTATRLTWGYRAFPVLAFLVVGGFLFLLVALSHAWTFSEVQAEPSMEPHSWLAGWTRWDATWYQAIADRGYWYDGAGRQSSVAFFPAYPLVIRAGAVILRDGWIAGTVATFLLGLGSTILFFRWCRDRLSSRSAKAAVLTLLLYPFSWFLFGAVYSDALFLCATLGAFVLLERDRPVLAGLVGIVATAARPVGPFVVAGLVLRAVERRRVIEWREPGSPTEQRRRFRPRLHLSHLRPADAGVLLSALGFVGYCLYLEWRFGSALAFLRVQNAPGWNHDADISAVFKTGLARYLYHWVPDLPHFTQGTQALVSVVALLLIPAVVRRFGWGYGLFAFAIVAVPASTTSDFVGMGRYLLAAFPCFAAAGDILARRPILLGAPLGIASAVGLVSFTSLFARWYLIT